MKHKKKKAWSRADKIALMVFLLELLKFILDLLSKLARTEKLLIAILALQILEIILKIISF